METGVDRFSRSPVVRIAVVLGWFVISGLAFLSRYERFTPALAALMAGTIVGIASLGLTWALLPAYQRRRRRA